MTVTLIQDLVASSHAARQYRPVVVGIIFNVISTPRVLCVSSAKNTLEAGFILGGINRDEDIEAALRREMSEKASIKPDWVDQVLFLGHRELDLEDTRPDRRGYTKGKRYFFYRVTVRTTDELKLDSKELYSYVWTDPEMAKRVLATTRPAKRDLMLEYLAKAVSS